MESLEDEGRGRVSERKKEEKVRGEGRKGNEEQRGRERERV